MIEKVFNVKFDRWDLASRAYWKLLSIRNIETTSFLVPCKKEFEVSVFGKIAKDNMNRIVKKMGGRVNDYR